MMIPMKKNPVAMPNETMSSRFNVKFVRSISRDEQTKLGCGAILGCLFFSIGFLALLKPYITPPPSSNLQLSMRAGLSMLLRENIITTQLQDRFPLENKLICSTLGPRSDTCEVYGDIRINGNHSRISVVSPQMSLSSGNTSWHIKPYARKEAIDAMQHVHEFSFEFLTDNITQEAPNCTNHEVPAILFSTGGFTGNIFHDFSDVLVPLFLTSHHFHGEVQFLVTDYKGWWINKYRVLLEGLSHYEIIDLDRDNRIHCYTSALVGLRADKDELSIDPRKSPHGYSMHNFSKFIRSSYNLKRKSAVKLEEGSSKKPRLLIISRKRSRRFTNLDDINKLASSLGYEVVIVEANVSTNLSNLSRIVNSCDVMMGVHGAGLANLVFLPTKSVFIQVIPLGGLEGHSRSCYKKAAAGMKLRYVEYKIKENESSLIEEYPLDHEVFRNPIAIHRRGWNAIRSTYLDNQNVKLDVGRFRSVLLNALELMRQRI